MRRYVIDEAILFSLPSLIVCLFVCFQYAEYRVPLVLMHMKGTPQTMKSLASYTNLVEEVHATLLEKSSMAQRNGLYRWHIVLDPGLGFAKDGEHNLELIRNSSKTVELGYPVLVGPSRKQFIGTITGQKEPAKRYEQSVLIDR